MHKLLLSLIIWTPIGMGLLTLAVNYTRLPKPPVHLVAFIGSLLSLALTVPLYTEFSLTGTMQFVESRPWIESLNAHYHLGIDGISMLLIMLNNMITPLVILTSRQTIKQHTAQYLACFLIMSGLINGTFMALDALLFYVFFEAMLIPLYLIIGIWGGPERIYASFKLFLYTLLGSLLMLVAIIYLYQQANNSFDILTFQTLPISQPVQLLLWVAFFFAFAVKVPMWPLHTWLPSAHVEAPTGGSIVLAAITLKIGAYGFLRFILPILPDACRTVAPFMITLSLIAIIYIGFVALVQTDMKKLIAYSSISHMGLVTLGLFLFSGNSLNKWALEGALIQMISHGFISAALFMCIGVMYDRVHSRQISDYGGVANKMPVFAAFMMLFAMANAALPGTSGFVGEFMILMGAVQTNFWIALMAGITLVLGAGYTLWLYKRVIFGDITHQTIADLKDIDRREFFVLAILAFAVLGTGLYPEMLVSKIHPTIDQLIHHVAQTKL